MKSEDDMYEFISEKEIEKIVLEHVINAKKVEDSSRELLKHAFEQIASRILLQVKLHIENSNGFKSVEKVYMETQRFKKRYEEYLEFDYHEDVPTENEKDILQGVFKSISGAINEFPRDKENPMEYERMLIVSTGLLTIKEAMNAIKDEVISGYSLPKGLSISVAEHLYEHMNASYDRLYAGLNAVVTEIVEELNDSDKRIELNKYVVFLEEQEIMLKNFVYINLEIGQDWQQQDKSSELTAKYIYPLRQLFQDIHTSISDVKHCIKKKKEIKPLEIKNVDKIIESNILRDKRLKDLIEIIEDDKNNTIDRIIIHINDELNKIAITELRNRKKESNRFELLSFIILELFDEGLACIKSIEVDDIQNDLHSKIIKGITDTLQLKYDSLKDKDTNYHLLKRECYLTYSETFLNFKNEFENKCEQYLEEAIEGSNASFNQAQGKFVKLLEKQKAENLETDLDYIKKDILFEVKTLEDLIHQSVDKLKESSESKCQEFVECSEKLFHMIISQLKRNDILTIKPSPHDVFNGKVHEILLAEESEEFSKGEIIRTQNSGFIFEQRILVRASVIASK